jgi:hypothetical protein
MKEKPYGVHVIVDPDFGERLREIPAGEPVWIVDSEVNHPVIQAIWQETDQKDFMIGITSFRADPNCRPEDSLTSQLYAIDMHFGDQSSDPPYSFLNVIGAAWSERIQKELDRLDLTVHQETPQGFRASKELANQQVHRTP